MVWAWNASCRSRSRFKVVRGAVVSCVVCTARSCGTFVVGCCVSWLVRDARPVLSEVREHLVLAFMSGRFFMLLGEPRPRWGQFTRRPFMVRVRPSRARAWRYLGFRSESSVLGEGH